MCEKELVGKILQGDEKAFEKFIDDHKLMVINTCYAFLHNKEEAEDVAQDVFLQAYESMGKFRFDCKLSTWLYRMAVNRTINICKSYHKRKVSLTLDDPDFRPDFEAEEIPVPERMEKEQRIHLLHEAIDTLPENQRTAIILNKYEELSYKEIAEVMKLSVGAVESLIFRGKSNLEFFFRIKKEKKTQKKRNNF